MSKVTYNGILKDNTKDKNHIHPQTNARQVLTGENNESNLQEELNAINDKFEQIKENETNKGAFKDYNALIAKYANGIENPIDRAGWTAIVEDEDRVYFYDTEENQWKHTSTINVEGIQSINGKSDKNIVLTGSDINATIDSTNQKTVTQHLQDIKNITNDIKTTKINNKPLSDDINLDATNIPTTFDDKASIQSHLSDLKLKYNYLESAVEEIENELATTEDKPNVLYLTNAQMLKATTSIVDSYSENQVAIPVDNGDYKQGSIYKFNVGGTETLPVYMWEEIATSSGGSAEPTTSNMLVGTEEAPIILFNLEAGHYYISGYLAPSPIGRVIRIKSYADSSTTFEDYLHVEIKDMKEAQLPRTKVAIYYDCVLVGYSEITVYQLSNYTAGTYILSTYCGFLTEDSIDLNASLTKRYGDDKNLHAYSDAISSNPKALTTINTKEYTPTGDYNPATKIYVDNGLAEAIPVKYVENVDEQKASPKGAYFYTKDAEDDIYVIRAGYQETPMISGTVYDTRNFNLLVSINKDILNVTIPSDFQVMETGYLYIYPCKKENGSSPTSQMGSIILRVIFDNYKVSRIAVYNFYGTQGLLIYENGEWKSERFNLYEAYPSTISQSSYPYVYIKKITDMDNTAYYIQDYINIIETVSVKDTLVLKGDEQSGGGTTIQNISPIKSVDDPNNMVSNSDINHLYNYNDYNNNSLYYSKLINEETIKPVRVALYEDLENVVGNISTLIDSINGEEV